MELLEPLEFLDSVELMNLSKSFAVAPLVTVLSVSVRTVYRSINAYDDCWWKWGEAQVYALLCGGEWQ